MPRNTTLARTFFGFARNLTQLSVDRSVVFLGRRRQPMRGIGKGEINRERIDVYDYEGGKEGKWKSVRPLRCSILPYFGAAPNLCPVPGMYTSFVYGNRVRKYAGLISWRSSLAPCMRGASIASRWTAIAFSFSFLYSDPQNKWVFNRAQCRYRQRTALGFPNNVNPTASTELRTSESTSLREVSRFHWRSSMPPWRPVASLPVFSNFLREAHIFQIYSLKNVKKTANTSYENFLPGFEELAEQEVYASRRVLDINSSFKESVSSTHFKHHWSPISLRQKCFIILRTLGRKEQNNTWTKIE